MMVVLLVSCSVSLAEIDYRSITILGGLQASGALGIRIRTVEDIPKADIAVKSRAQSKARLIDASALKPPR